MLSESKPFKTVYSAAGSPYALIPMIMIAAALNEELKTGMGLCRDRKKIQGPGLNLWQAARGDYVICFLRTGVGPRRSAATLREALKVVKPYSVMVVGYAGAIDPGLKLGDMVVVARASAFSLDKNRPDWKHVRLEGTYNLSYCETLASSAKSAGLNVYTGDTLTSSFVLGQPEHKKILFEKFHASIVDMETASIARVAKENSIPIGCVRVVSDEAEDSFLAPFSYDPLTGISARAKSLFDKGMMHIYREWKEHAAVAKANLHRFLLHYL